MAVTIFNSGVFTNKHYKFGEVMYNFYEIGTGNENIPYLRQKRIWDVHPETGIFKLAYLSNLRS